MRNAAESEPIPLLPRIALGIVVTVVLFGLLAPSYGIRNTLIALAIVAAGLAVRALILAARKTKQTFDDELDGPQEP